MRWRLVDRIDHFAPWEEIRGRKAVSFEEYSLLARFGRKGEYPPSLVLGCVVELSRLLVAASSEFSLTGTLAAVPRFECQAMNGVGAVLQLGAQVIERSSDSLAFECDVRREETPVARGSLVLSLSRLADGHDPDWVRGLFQEVHVATR